MKRQKRTALLIIVFIVAAASISRAEETSCTYKKKIAANAHEVEIGNASHIAVPRQDFMNYIKMEEGLKAAEEKIKELQAGIEEQEGIVAQQRQEIEQLKVLLAKAEETAEKWEKAAEKCENALKRCLGSSRISLEIGAGKAPGSGAAGLIGIGFQKVRAWGLLGEGGETGWFLGYEIKRW